MKIIKNIAGLLISGIILVSVALNINKQLNTLIEAKRTNRQMAEEIERLERENRVWEEKIGYSTTSAFLEEEVREKLGMGEREDYWLELPEGNEEENKADETVIKKPIWRQWLELFNQ